VSETVYELRWPVVTSRGVAGLAVRLGRALEEWGERAGKPEARAELEQRRALEAGSQRDRAAQEHVLRGGYRGF